MTIKNENRKEGWCKMITDALKRVWDKYACWLLQNNIDHITQERIAQNTAVIYDFIDSNADEINALSERPPAVGIATEALIEMLKTIKKENYEQKINSNNSHLRLYT